MKIQLWILAIIFVNYAHSDTIIQLKTWWINSSTAAERLSEFCTQPLFLVEKHDFPTDFILVQDFLVTECLFPTKLVAAVQKDRPIFIENPLKGVIQPDLANLKITPNQDILKPENFYTNITSKYSLDSKFWQKNISGQKIKIAILDTGISSFLARRYQKSIRKILDWTNEHDLGVKSANQDISDVIGQNFWNQRIRQPPAEDLIGHGSFITSILVDPEFGIVPNAELYIFKVFTSKQISFTSWFLNCFNFAVSNQINLINLSIGGPDFKDFLLIDKIKQLSHNNILLVSAIGNDGPTYGSVNTPADLPYTLSVGGLDKTGNAPAEYSSRGFTKIEREVYQGFGKLQPDLVADSANILGYDPVGVYKILSGTSVACPIVTGFIALRTPSLLGVSG